jgi:hypothetical protein
MVWSATIWFSLAFLSSSSFKRLTSSAFIRPHRRALPVIGRLRDLQLLQTSGSSITSLTGRSASLRLWDDLLRRMMSPLHEIAPLTQ